MSKRFIDLNADMGEYANGDQQANEAALMPLVSSCSIACGGHAGDETTMRKTLRLARAHNVSVGAHPAYPDREGFGRRHLTFEPAALASSLHAQISELHAIAKSEGMILHHIKPHGALYNDAVRNIDLANLIADATGKAIVVGPQRSALETAARAHGRAFAAEGFVDRLYLASGALTPRSEPGAVIADISVRAKQALAIARGDSFAAADGDLRLAVKTLCIHSDSPGAVDTAKAVRLALEKDGFAIRAFE